MMVRIFGIAWFVLTFASSALAQNPNWPPQGPVEPADLMDPGTWPSDPGYGYDIRGEEGETCEPSGTCWDGRQRGGQWNFWSWTPPEALARETFRTEETMLGSGTWTDMAWQYTIGDRSVVIAVLDSGIRWRERDLVNQYYINAAELTAAGLDPHCLPEAPAGHTGDPVDIDGDGYLTMRDWFVGRTEEETAALNTEIDMIGNGNGIAEPGDLIVICSDGTDDDGNGYIDDISGWDFHHNDNDPNDDTDFGHGTGEARWSMAEGNNGIGEVGYCPECRALMVRAGDSFIVDVQDYAQSVIFAVDSGAVIIQEALGSLNHSTYMRRANDYAYDNDVLIVASAADENSRHHNFPGTSNHTLYVHAIQYAGAEAQDADSFLAFNNCTNYGGQLALSAPGTGCSSEATGVTSGIAGLVVSASRSSDRPDGPLDPPLRAEEMRQLLITSVDDIYIPESQPDHPAFNQELYPSREGWDQRFGYGRINAYGAVRAVWEGRIPPEVDVVYPDWFRPLYRDRTPSITLRGKIAADRAESFDYVIEWAAGIEPNDEDFTTLAEASGVTEAIEGDLVDWDISNLEIDNPGEVENRFTATVRIRVTANYPAPIGAVTGEQRRVYAILEDPDLLPGFPLALGLRNPSDEFFAASGEGSPKLADLDGDDKLEIVFADSDGLLHVFNEDGSELPGYPVRLGVLRGMDPADPNNILGSAAYAGAVPTDDLSPAVVINVPAVGDLDGDGN
ncbi:MAG: S8 family serine peptidase, partial [Myxococcota bacterium]